MLNGLRCEGERMNGRMEGRTFHLQVQVIHAHVIKVGLFGGLSSIDIYPNISNVKVDPSSAQPHVVSRR